MLRNHKNACQFKVHHALVTSPRPVTKIHWQRNAFRAIIMLEAQEFILEVTALGSRILHSGVDDPVVKNWETLTRVAQAVGFPISAFIGDSGPDSSNPLAEAREARMQALVRCYLHDANDDEKRRFFRFVQSLDSADKR